MISYLFNLLICLSLFCFQPLESAYSHHVKYSYANTFTNNNIVNCFIYLVFTLLTTYLDSITVFVGTKACNTLIRSYQITDILLVRLQVLDKLKQSSETSSFSNTWVCLRDFIKYCSHWIFTPGYWIKQNYTFQK